MTRDSKLQNVLRANAAFSGLSGLLMLVFSARLAETLGGLPLWIVLAIGVGLLVYAADLVWTARAKVKRSAVALFVAADCGWVIGSALFLLLAPFSPTELGVGLVVGAALIVGLFAGAQALALPEEA